MTDIKCLEYDDEAAIIFIQKKLPKELNISDDEIQYVLDVIYDFYESKGFLNEDTDEEVEIVEEELLHYILKAVKKDGMDVEKLTEENVQLILERMGGGGHFDVAGAQIVSDSINAVLSELKYSIDLQFSE